MTKRCALCSFGLKGQGIHLHVCLPSLIWQSLLEGIALHGIAVSHGLIHNIGRLSRLLEWLKRVAMNLTEKTWALILKLRRASAATVQTISYIRTFDVKIYTYRILYHPIASFRKLHPFLYRIQYPWSNINVVQLRVIYTYLHSILTTLTCLAEPLPPCISRCFCVFPPDRPLLAITWVHADVWIVLNKGQVDFN